MPPNVTIDAPMNTQKMLISFASSAGTFVAANSLCNSGNPAAACMIPPNTQNAPHNIIKMLFIAPLALHRDSTLAELYNAPPKFI